MRLLPCGQVIRPSYRWLPRYRTTVLLQEARALIDPAGFARLVAHMDATGRAAVVLAPRLPQAVRHRRPAQRAAATHRGEDPRPSCWNDDGIRRHLSRGRHRASPRVHRPPPQPAPPPRSTAPSLPATISATGQTRPGAVSSNASSARSCGAVTVTGRSPSPISSGPSSRNASSSAPTAEVPASPAPREDSIMSPPEALTAMLSPGRQAAQAGRDQSVTDRSTRTETVPARSFHRPGQEASDVHPSPDPCRGRPPPSRRNACHSRGLSPLRVCPTHPPAPQTAATRQAPTDERRGRPSTGPAYGPVPFDERTTKVRGHGGQDGVTAVSVTTGTARHG